LEYGARGIRQVWGKSINPLLGKVQTLFEMAEFEVRLLLQEKERDALQHWIYILIQILQNSKSSLQVVFQSPINQLPGLHS
jgi:hypothetical protein